MNEEHINNETEILETKRSVKKRSSKFGILLTVFVSALITIFYVSNVINVTTLMKQKQRLTNELEVLKNENAALKSELNALQSPSRITRIAQEEFNMTKIDSAPIFVPIDED